MKNIVIVIMMLLVTVNTAWTQASNSENNKLLSQLGFEKRAEHFEAALLLAKVGKPVVSDLLRLLKDERWYVQLTVIWILGELRDIAAVEPLIQMLKS